MTMFLTYLMRFHTVISMLRTQTRDPWEDPKEETWEEPKKICWVA